MAPLIRKAVMPPELRASPSDVEEIAETAFVIQQTARKYFGGF